MHSRLQLRLHSRLQLRPRPSWLPLSAGNPSDRKIPATRTVPRRTTGVLRGRAAVCVPSVLPGPFAAGGFAADGVLVVRGRVLVRGCGRVLARTALVVVAVVLAVTVAVTVAVAVAVAVGHHHRVVRRSSSSSSHCCSWCWWCSYY